MSSGYYRFGLGELDCVSLSDGSRDYPLSSFFANVPAERVREALQRRGLPVDSVTTPYTYLYVDTSGHRLLVDMGAGDFEPSTGRLLRSMAAAGIEPSQIDCVVITHAHPDHIGGALDGQGQPLFPNADFYISHAEWHFWFSEVSLEHTPEIFVRIARKNLEPLRHRVHLVTGIHEIAPGIRAVPAPGHTPGHIVVEVASAGQRLLYIGDAVLHPLHLAHPDWLPIFDILPEEAAASKRRIFDQAAAGRTLVLGQHFSPFPSLGYVHKNGSGWQWQPVGRNGRHAGGPRAAWRNSVRGG